MCEDVHVALLDVAIDDLVQTGDDLADEETLDALDVGLEVGVLAPVVVPGFVIESASGTAVKHVKHVKQKERSKEAKREAESGTYHSQSPARKTSFACSCVTHWLALLRLHGNSYPLHSLLWKLSSK